MKEKIKKLKIMWKDEKGHAIISLCLWGIFFAFIAITCFISSLFNNDEKPVYNTYSYEKANNYEYNYTISYNNGIDKTLSIEGIRYNDKETFEIDDDNEFYIENNQIISITNQNINKYLVFDIIKLQPSSIATSISKNKTFNEIKYKDGSKKTEYIINVNDFNILNNKELVKATNTDTIKITTVENNNKITEVDIDITNLVKLVNSKTNKYKIKIEYTNINNINDFNIKHSS